MRGPCSSRRRSDTGDTLQSEVFRALHFPSKNRISDSVTSIAEVLTPARPSHRQGFGSCKAKNSGRSGSSQKVSTDLAGLANMLRARAELIEEFPKNSQSLFGGGAKKRKLGQEHTDVETMRSPMGFVFNGSRPLLILSKIRYR